MTNSDAITDQRPVPCLLDNKPFATQKTFSVERNDQVTTERRDELYQVCSLSVGEVDKVAQSAQAGFEQWKLSTIDQRRDVIARAKTLLQERADEIVDIVVAETVVTRGFAQYEVRVAAMTHLTECLDSMASALKAEVLPEYIQGVRRYVYRRPFGVVLAVAPWNAPFVLGLRAVLWAIAAGNSVILKTSEHAALTHLSVARLLVDAGLPSGVLSVVHVDPQDAPAVTEALIAQRVVWKINFTGSTRVGRILAQVAAKHLKPIVLELGGKAPVIVLEDADLSVAANNIVFGGFLNTNQICMSVNNILVHASRKDALVKELQAIYTSKPDVFRAGQDASHQIRGLFTEASAQRLRSLYDDAIEKGASVAVGQSGFQGAVVQPVILGDINQSMQIFSEETFGPVLSLITFSDEEEAIRVANQNNAGLAAAVFGKDVEHAFQVAQRIQAGQVHVNSHSVHDHGLMPHGGWKESGFGRMGGGVDGIREFTQTQGFTVQAGSHIPLELL